MRYDIRIPYGDTTRCYSLLHCSDSQRIELDGVVILDVWKIHNHRYCLQGFFYRCKVIVPILAFSTKAELYGAIQELLQQYL